MADAVIERFKRKIMVMPETNCWLWLGSITKPSGKRPRGGGYGLFQNGEKLELAHRFSYKYYKGPIEKPLVIDHLCRNRNCVNPGHLEAVTHSENVRRGLSPTIIAAVSAKRAAKRAHCPNGHQYTTGNTYIQISSRDGEYRVCKICRKAAYERGNAKQRAARC